VFSHEEVNKNIVQKEGLSFALDTPYHATTSLCVTKDMNELPSTPAQAPQVYRQKSATYFHNQSSTLRIRLFVYGAINALRRRKGRMQDIVLRRTATSVVISQRATPERRIEACALVMGKECANVLFAVFLFGVSIGEV
jgi:hypothetical protein